MITVRLYSMWNTVYQLRAFLFGQFHSWHEAHQLVLLRLWVSGNLPLGGSIGPPQTRQKALGGCGGLCRGFWGILGGFGSANSTRKNRGN